jgi:hypothetical protein
LKLKIWDFTFLAHFEAAGQVGPEQRGSQINGKRSLVHGVRIIALELSALLDALKARQRLWNASNDGFKNDCIMSGISFVWFWEHQEYSPSTSHLSPSLTPEVMNVDNLKSVILTSNTIWYETVRTKNWAHTTWYQFK